MMFLSAAAEHNLIWQKRLEHASFPQFNIVTKNLILELPKTLIKTLCVMLVQKKNISDHPSLLKRCLLGKDLTG